MGAVLARTVLALLTALLLLPVPVRAEEARIAVATNFRDAAAEIGRAFAAATGHSALFSYGSTGQLFAQIAQGAPFDVFLAADKVRVEQAVTAKLAVAGSQQTYATGRIVLFSMDEALVTGPETLKTARFERLAVAAPQSAPYGAAAIESMRAMGVYDLVGDRIVRGQNVAQAYQFVHSGSADLGFVALSQIRLLTVGSRWIVPETMHAPIAQDAVLLERGADNAAARAFLAFLRSTQADQVREKFGYGPAK